MAIDTKKMQDDASNILNLLKKISPGSGVKKAIENLQGNQSQIMKAIKQILKLNPTTAGATQAIEFVVDRYKLPESVAARLVVNEMTDANVSTDPSGSTDEGFPSRPEFESSAEDTSMPPKRKIDLEKIRNILKDIDRSDFQDEGFPDLGPPKKGGGDVGPLRPFPTNIEDSPMFLEGPDVKDSPMFLGEEQKKGLLDLLFRFNNPEAQPMRGLAMGGRVNYAEGKNMKMASAPDIMDDLNQLSLMLYKKPLKDLTDDEYDRLQEYAKEKLAMGGRVMKQTGGITETRQLPPEFLEAAQKTFLADLTRQAGLPTVTTATTQQPGETAEQFAARQAQAQQFGITRAGMAEVAPQVAAQDALQAAAYTQATDPTTGLGSFQPFLTKATTAADAMTPLTGTGAGAADVAGSIASYQSPYQQQVIDATLTEFDRQAQIRANQNAAATLGTPGAFGGGREGVQRAEYQAASDRNRAATQAQLLQTGFQNAAARRQQDLANQQAISNQQRGLGAAAQDFNRAQISGLGTLCAA